MCGVFGIFGHDESAHLTYLGLHALQHRGQEAAGICSSDGTAVRGHRELGLVADVFSAEALAPGNGIGRGSALIPNVVAAPGVDICADVPFGSSSVTVHGFLAKNK